ncbi:hypothetical protein ACPC54_19840 [Kitasatospora sp. NPDC094028]
MEDPIWTALPAEARDEVDANLRIRRFVMAMKVIRDASPAPAPGLPACTDLVAARYEELGLGRP